MNKILLLKPIVSTLSLVFILSCSNDESPVVDARNDDCLCLNDIQVIGSHNSYKIAIEEPILQFVSNLDASLALGLEYEHIPINDQLDLGLRNLEFDVFNDPDGGHYKNPEGLNVIRDQGLTPLPYDVEGQLLEPGLKMFHIQDVDFRSHHLVFKDGLIELKQWSDNNSSHFPIFVLINAKDALIPLTNPPVGFDMNGIKQIDNEIREVFDESQLITPDDVRADRTSLEQAVLEIGWPSLESSRGKIMFILDENDRKTDLYLANFPNLEGAAMFVNVEEGNPEAGFMIINDPVQNLSRIQELVRKGYMVRTRADSETLEARINSLTRATSAIESGAQIISTDYYIPSQLFSSQYQVTFGDGSYERVVGN